MTNAINIKYRYVVQSFMSVFSRIWIQMEMKNQFQQSFPEENDYEGKLYSGTNDQTSNHNLVQHDAWINPYRSNFNYNNLRIPGIARVIVADLID